MKGIPRVLKMSEFIISLKILPQNDLKSSSSNNTKHFETKSCCMCSKPHFIAYCYIFKGKLSKEKLELVKANKLCFNCLSQHHDNECKTHKTCLICGSKHHTLLHESLQPAGASYVPESNYGWP